MAFSNAIFFAADWAICYPVMLFHCPFASRMTENPGTKTFPAWQRIDTDVFLVSADSESNEDHGQPPEGYSANIISCPGLARRRVMERLAQLSCSIDTEL